MRSGECVLVGAYRLCGGICCLFYTELRDGRFLSNTEKLLPHWKSIALKENNNLQHQCVLNLLVCNFWFPFSCCVKYVDVE
jgi:hypothetical protein